MNPKPIAMRDALLDHIWKAMADDKSIFFICADFGSPVLDRIRADYPDQFLNVGIAEQNLINVSAGLALEGFTVFAYAIAPFITMRCYEQLRVNLALLSEVRNMNVNLIGVGAGYSYVVSGPTHQCYEDISLIRALPNFQLLSPSDHVTTVALFDRCTSVSGPKYLRLDAQVLPVLYEGIQPDLKAGFHVLRTGCNVCLVATGYMVHTALHVADELGVAGISAGVIDLIDISGFDRERFKNHIALYTSIVTLEEGFRGCGGIDALLFEFISRQEMSIKMLNFGVNGGYHFELGSRQEIHEKVGIGRDLVRDIIMTLVQSTKNQLSDK